MMIGMVVMTICAARNDSGVVVLTKFPVLRDVLFCNELSSSLAIRSLSWIICTKIYCNVYNRDFVIKYSVVTQSFHCPTAVHRQIVATMGSAKGKMILTMMEISFAPSSLADSSR